MPTIVQAIKTKGLFIPYEDRELKWSDGAREWQVWGSNPFHCLCSTKDQETAVDFLLGKR